LAAIRGASITSDANSLAAISEEHNAIDLMFLNLFRESGIEAERVNYVNAHGTSTVQNDVIESRILERIFPKRPYVNSTKSILGHTIGASGAIELIVTVLSIRDGIIHRCRNLRNPVLDLNFCQHTVNTPIEYAVTHSFGFGGHNVGLIVENINH
jgi:3-oxoacyl-[acyl-carrier-protein] synthase II